MKRTMYAVSIAFLVVDAVTMSASDPASTVTPNYPVAPVSAGDWASYNCTVTGWRFNEFEKTLSAANADRTARGPKNARRRAPRTDPHPPS
jgi:hypothetical protein